MAPSRGAGQASFDATFEMDSDDEFSGFYPKKRRRVSGNSLSGNVYRYQLPANSVDEATTKFAYPTSKTWTLPATTTKRL